ncbi:hypothetical protein [Sphingomonas phage Kimi]|nr:hypothetical protein [Sphingomonas phage Kimi]
MKWDSKGKVHLRGKSGRTVCGQVTTKVRATDNPSRVTCRNCATIGKPTPKRVDIRSLGEE